MNNMVHKDINDTRDYLQAMHHVLNCIATKGVDNCSYETQVAYERIRDLIGKLNHDTVLYRP